MTLINIIEATLSSLLAATLLAIFLWVISWVRNTSLERTLKDGIKPEGTIIGYDQGTKKGSFSVRVNNYSNVNINIRKVLLVGAEEQEHIVLEYDDNEGVSQTLLVNKLLKGNFKGTHFFRGLSDSEKTNEFIQMPPFTSAMWKIKPEILSHKKWFARELIFAVEYPTIFGNTALVIIKGNEKHLKKINKSLNNVINSVHNDTGLEVPLALKQWREKNITNRPT